MRDRDFSCLFGHVDECPVRKRIEPMYQKWLKRAKARLDACNPEEPHLFFDAPGAFLHELREFCKICYTLHAEGAKKYKEAGVFDKVARWSAPMRQYPPYEG